MVTVLDAGRSRPGEAPILMQQEAIIFDIQRFSLHDGPGIRTTIFFKGCPLHCAWCQNPESQAFRPEIAFYAEVCQGSADCKAACPEDAIDLSLEGRLIRSRCDACGKCADECAFGALRRVGRVWNPDSLCAEVLKDRDYFQNSDGGVTLSGGEPLVHSRFLAEFLPLIKRHKVHVALETSGAVAWKQIERVLPHLDLIYYDLKHMNPKSHKEHTGRDSTQILKNFERLSHSSATVQPRMPIIPGYNDSPENIRNTARFLQQNGKTVLHCLPYHNLGANKIQRIGRKAMPLATESPGPAIIQQIKASFARAGITVIFYD